jgi:hypothetical protein
LPPCLGQPNHEIASGFCTRCGLVVPKRKKRSNRRHRQGSEGAWQRAKKRVRERSGGACEARVEGVCTGRHEHTHHVKLRSRGGSDDPSNLKGVCNACHRYIHDNSLIATELGLMR